MNPQVSICIPSYNNEDHIRIAIESVLSQSFGDFELIISDDCSRDRTFELIRAFKDSRIKIIQNQVRGGIQTNWNSVAKAAQGQFIKILCGDDVLSPGCLAEQVRILRDPRFKDVVLTCSRRRIIDEVGKTLIAEWNVRGLKGEVLGGDVVRAIVRSGTNIIGEPCAVMARTEAVKQVGFFDGSLPYMIDVDLWVRVLAYGSLFADEQVLCSFRVSSGSLSARLKDKQAVQSREFFRRVRSRFPTKVSRMDYFRGVVMATLLGFARAFFFGLKRGLRKPKVLR